MIIKSISCVAVLFFLCDAVLAQEPIIPIKNAKPKPNIFKATARNKPLKITSGKEAAKFFSKKSLAVLHKKVDFKKQFLLVFAWKGSGQDRLVYDVAESFPEQITFHIKPGRTRDLRPHTYVFALRSNVKWRVKR